MTLTKAELADLLFEQLGLNKREAKDMVEHFFEEIRIALERGDSGQAVGLRQFPAARKAAASRAQSEDRRRDSDHRAARRDVSRQPEAEGHGRSREPCRTSRAEARAGWPSSSGRSPARDVCRGPKAELPPIPAKRYFTIGEVSDLCAVKPHVLRYWEQEFAQLKPVKRRGNRRYYQHHEVLLIRRIRDLLYEQGFTINGARHRLESEVAAPGAPASPRRSRRHATPLPARRHAAPAAPRWTDGSRGDATKSGRNCCESGGCWATTDDRGYNSRIRVGA